MSDEKKVVQDAILACQTIRSQLKGNFASFRSRVLLDMFLLELGRDLARLTARRGNGA